MLGQQDHCCEYDSNTVEVVVVFGACTASEDYVGSYGGGLGGGLGYSSKLRGTHEQTLHQDIIVIVLVEQGVRGEGG